MPYFHQAEKWRVYPTGPFTLRPYWLSRGLQRFYLLGGGPSSAYLDHVSKTVLGASVASGPTFRGDSIAASGDTTNYATFPSGVTPHVPPVTLITVSEQAVGVLFSMMDGGAAAWFGIYTAGGASFNTTNNNSFDGSVSDAAYPAGLKVLVPAVAVYRGLNDFRGSFNGSGVVTDTSLTALTTSDATMTFGHAFHNGVRDNPATAGARMQLFAAANKAWSDGEIQAVSLAPYGELLEPRVRRSYFEIPSGGYLLVKN